MLFHTEKTQPYSTALYAAHLYCVCTMFSFLMYELQAVPHAPTGDEQSNS